MIIVTSEEDDYGVRSWDVYDLSNFQDYTREGVETLLCELDCLVGICVFRDVPDFLQKESRNITWYDWDPEDTQFAGRALNLEAIQRDCEHKWDKPTAISRDGNYLAWSRVCSRCGKVETTHDAIERE